jgi:hypothetical protein
MILTTLPTYDIVARVQTLQTSGRTISGGRQDLGIKNSGRFAVFQLPVAAKTEVFRQKRKAARCNFREEQRKQPRAPYVA